MHVAVTGASSGIGEAIAREFGAHGADLTLVARREERLRALADSLPGRSVVTPRDLSRIAEMTSWIAEAEAALGPIDVLINNAGLQFVAPTAEMDCDDGELSLTVNLHAPLRIIRAVLPGMIARGGGHIVNISSIAALAPSHNMAYYNASKAALAAASESLRGEVRASGVNVLTVYPGIIPTEMSDKAYHQFEESFLLRQQPQGTTQVLARLIRQAIAKRKARLIYPRANRMARWFPSTTRLLLDRFTPPLKR